MTIMGMHEMWLLYSLLAIIIVWIVISPLTCCRHK
jgi:hypothetical protein